MELRIIPASSDPKRAAAMLRITQMSYLQVRCAFQIVSGFLGHMNCW